MIIDGKIWFDKVEYFSFEVDPSELLDLEDEDDVYDYLIEKMYNEDPYDEKTFDSDHEFLYGSFDSFIDEWKKLKYGN